MQPGFLTQRLKRWQVSARPQHKTSTTFHSPTSLTPTCCSAAVVESEELAALGDGALRPALGDGGDVVHLAEDEVD